MSMTPMGERVGAVITRSRKLPLILVLEMCIRDSYHIDLRRRRLVIQLQGKGDLPLSRAAHAPAACHAAHFQDRLLPAQHLSLIHI